MWLIILGLILLFLGLGSLVGCLSAYLVLRKKEPTKDYRLYIIGIAAGSFVSIVGIVMLIFGIIRAVKAKREAGFQQILDVQDSTTCDVDELGNELTRMYVKGDQNMIDETKNKINTDCNQTQTGVIKNVAKGQYNDITKYLRLKYLRKNPDLMDDTGKCSETVASRILDSIQDNTPEKLGMKDYLENLCKEVY